MSNRCVACGADLTGKRRFRDTDGNYYCAACLDKARSGRCDICNADTTGRPSYYRSDGKFFCEKCFQDAVAASPVVPSPEPTPAPTRTAKLPDSARSISPDRGFRIKPGGNLLEITEPPVVSVHITDAAEPVFSGAAVAVILCAGTIGGMFTQSVLIGALLVCLLVGLHYLLLRITGE